MIEPTDLDLYRNVIYVPGHAKGDLGHPHCECGYITSFNKWSVFVRYGTGSTSAGTLREDLYWEHEPKPLPQGG